MTSAIQQAFERAAGQGRSAFLPFITGGYPDGDTFLSLFKELAEAGADVIEVGLPFSDPLADGPIIQKSSHAALEMGMTPPKVFELIGQARKGSDVPVVLMTYFNPILRRGLETFAAEARKAGVSGVIVPDLPLEEADEWKEAASRNGIDTIFMIAPTTPPERRKEVIRSSRGFVYAVARTGVTGAETSISKELSAYVTAIKTDADLPVAVGFGVSNPEDARLLAGLADGVIVGSALLKSVMEQDGAEAQVAAVSRLARDIAGALKREAVQ